MCKILIGVKNNKENKDFNAVFEAQIQDLRKEKDGIGAVTISWDNKLEIFRRFLNYDEVFDEVRSRLDKSKFYAIHTRTGTSGSKDIDNVHFFQNGDYAFAHNGFVSAYHSWKNFGGRLGFSGEGGFPTETYYNSEAGSILQDDDIDFPGDASDDFTPPSEILECKGCQSAKLGYCRRHKDVRFKQDDKTSLLVVTKKGEKKDDPCDSFQFLRNIPRPLTEEIIGREVEEKEFTGMGLFLNVKTLEIHLIIKKECYGMSDGKTFATFTSYSPNKEYSKAYFVKYFGIPVLKQEKEVKIALSHYRILTGVQRLELPQKPSKS